MESAASLIVQVGMCSGKHSINDFMNSNMSAEWENSTLDHVDTPPASPRVEETASTVCFDFLEFLNNHMNVLGFTEKDVNNVYEELRMMDTRDLNHLQNITYLDDLACLNPAQKRRLWTLVKEVQADRRYSLDSEGAVEERAASEEKVAGWLNSRDVRDLLMQLANLKNLL